MLLISPAKTLDFSEFCCRSIPTTTSPQFLPLTQKLIDHLKQYSLPEIQKMMNLSKKLAEINYQRYQDWQIVHRDQQNSKPGVYAFRGDVYQGLDITSLRAKEISFLKKNLYILSGLYGLLNAFDLIQPYRLEMGTTFTKPLELLFSSTQTKSEATKINNLYSFWQKTITNYILDRNPAIIINLASNEYAKVINWKKILGKNIPVVIPIFKDFKSGKYKVISFFAKKARGMMCSFLAKKNSLSLNVLKKFNCQRYYFSEEIKQKTHTELIFLRDS